jgi:hypothetical protein
MSDPDPFGVEAARQWHESAGQHYDPDTIPEEVDDIVQWQLDNPPQNRNTDKEAKYVLCPECKGSWHGIPLWRFDEHAYCYGEFSPPNDLHFKRRKGEAE